MAAHFELDKIDRRILAALQDNGRITNQALSEKVALSASACLARVRRLEQAGVIEGYNASLNPWALGAGLILYAEVTLSGHHPAEMAAFEKAISKIPQIVEASQTSGSFDYLLKVVLGDMPEWTGLAEGLTERGLGITKIVTHVMMKPTKVFRGYPVEPET